MAGLELKIPPPLVALTCGLAMKGIAMLVEGGTAAARTTGEFATAAPAEDATGGWPALRLVALALALLGVAVTVLGMQSFRRARTTINPLKPADASALVTSGIYRLTRNPMYLGLAMLLIGWTAWLGTPWALAGVVAFVAWITRFQIVPEERALSSLFGAEFEAYRARVRRWI